MKKFLILMILAVCFLNLKAQRLEKGLWQLQNPEPMNISAIMSFKNGQVKNLMSDLFTGLSREAVGTYTLSGNKLTIIMNGYRYLYSVKWHSVNKVSLTTNQGTLYYGQINTSEDQYMNNFLFWCNLNGLSSGGVYKDKPTPKRQESCYTCRGIGSCKVCGGSGIYSGSITGTRSVCKACEGTGKCWHCNGSGIQ